MSQWYIYVCVVVPRKHQTKMSTIQEPHDSSIHSLNWPFSPLGSHDDSYGNNAGQLLFHPSGNEALPLFVDPPIPFSPSATYPEFATIPCFPDPQPIICPQKRRRRRGSRGDPEEQQRKAVRKERNRRFARESMERKSRYMRELESEVLALRAELAQYKEKFARYELIDKHRGMAGGENRFVVTCTLDEMSRTNAAPSQFPHILVSWMERMIEERKRAIAQLSQLILRLVVPLPLRLCFWEAENNFDLQDPQGLCRRLGYELDVGEMRVLATILNIFQGDPAAERERRERIAMASQRIRRDAKQMLESQRDMEHEGIKLWRLVRNNVIQKCSMSGVAQEFKFYPRLISRPELSDLSILHVQDQDFTVDTSADSEVDRGCGSDCTVKKDPISLG